MDAKHATPIEIFKAGRHVDMHGVEYHITADHLAQVARCYDPSKHEAPCVIGHPKTNAPAYGWVHGLRADGDLLIADVGQLEPAFAEAVKAGRWKKRSAAFLLPDSPGNPTPGQYYLNHVGFLGAQAPAVKGLRDVQFAANAQVAEFATDRRWAYRGIADMFRRLRDWLVSREGTEGADEILPTWQIDSLIEAAHPDGDAVPAFAAPDVTPAADQNPAADAIAQRESELAQREAAIAAREAQQLEREQAAAALQQQEREQAAAAFASGLVDGGLLLPRDAGVVAGLLVLLDAQPVAAFASPDGEQQLQPAAALRTFLAALPKRVDYVEKSAAEPAPASAAFSAPPGTFVDPTQLEVLSRARAWMAEHPGNTLVQAVQAVTA